MRTYAPASASTVLEGILAEPSLARGVVHHAVLPARPAIYGDFPAWLDTRIVDGLAARGIERPYLHQAEAIEAVHDREDVVVVTPTASGKTLCYALPILQSITEDPAARALLLFPTKALGQDQVTEFGELAAAANLSISTSTYDGDTPAPIRSAIRAAGQVVVTNPDMLHSAILPHHTKWFQLFEQLRIIVDRRTAHVSWRLRQSRRERPPPAVTDLRALRQLAGHRLLLRDDRQPGRAGRDADGSTQPGHRSDRVRPPASAMSCWSIHRSFTRKAAHGAPP